MQLSLFPEYFLDILDKCEGILAAPLQITQRLLWDDCSIPFLNSLKKDQHTVSKKRAEKRKRTLSGKGGSKDMAPHLVAFFCVARAFYPDIYGERGYKMILESSSIKETLAQHEVKKFPGRSTIHDQLSNLSEETLTLFWQCLLEVISREELDDLSALTMDSTAIEADSAWPLDSLLLSKLSAQIISRFETIIKTLPVVKQRLFPLARLKKHAARIKALDFEISCQKGKKDGDTKRQNLYENLLTHALKVEERLDVLLKRMDMQSIEIKNVMAFNKLCQNFYDKILTTQRRFGQNLEDYGAYEPEKIFSVSDEDAVFIKKGGRETVFGYRPTFGQSMNGFITAFTLESGNTSDAKAFKLVVENHKENCSVIPDFINTDDGYSSKENLDWAINQGASMVSFGGSKGKVVLGEELYDSEAYKEARKLRSASEATISNLKNVWKLNRFSVCGTKRIRQEVLICIIGYNLERMASMLKKVALKKAA
ncbi:MAG: transposase [Lentisphaeraceae bacterium]|nr:transposase [Lentisphaeraceae bacterium]